MNCKHGYSTAVSALQTTPCFSRSWGPGIEDMAIHTTASSPVSDHTGEQLRTSWLLTQDLDPMSAALLRMPTLHILFFCTTATGKTHKSRIQLFSFNKHYHLNAYVFDYWPAEIYEEDSGPHYTAHRGQSGLPCALQPRRCPHFIMVHSSDSWACLPRATSTPRPWQDVCSAWLLSGGAEEGKRRLCERENTQQKKMKWSN